MKKLRQDVQGWFPKSSRLCLNALQWELWRERPWYQLLLPSTEELTLSTAGLGRGPKPKLLLHPEVLWHSTLVFPQWVGLLASVDYAERSWFFILTKACPLMDLGSSLSPAYTKLNPTSSPFPTLCAHTPRIPFPFLQTIQFLLSFQAKLNLTLP